MRRRPAPEPLSPRALARLRTDRRTGWVPSPDDLGLGAEDVDGAGAAARHGGVRGEGAGDGHGAWVRAPAAVVGARWQPGRAAVLGVALVTVVAVLLLGLRVAWAREAPGEPVRAPGPAGVSTGAVAVGAPPPSTAATGAPVIAPTPTPSGSASAADGLVVHVVGEVRRPGVLRLAPGSRVVDAVDAAGGATSRAELGGLNLARVLVDGEQVRVPRPGEEVVAPAPGPAPGQGGGAGEAGTGTPVPLNTADLAALDALPGIGPVIAQRILDWRATNGGFTSVDELSEVSGIGEKLLAQVRPLVTV